METELSDPGSTIAESQHQGICSEVGYKRPPVAGRFKPGQSGNPGGRRRGDSLTARIAEILARETIGGRPISGGRCIADLLAESIVREALKGKYPQQREILERMDGKVPDRVSGHDGGPLWQDDLSGLSDDDLVELQRIAGKLCRAPEGDG